MEEEQLQPTSGTYPITASGNEDIDDHSGNDTDTSPAGLGIVANVTSGVLGVSGGDGTFVFNLAGGIEGCSAGKDSTRFSSQRNMRAIMISSRPSGP